VDERLDQRTSRRSELGAAEDVPGGLADLARIWLRTSQLDAPPGEHGRQP
jgi:hypothetical protein